jgi:hypothetical protein
VSCPPRRPYRWWVAGIGGAAVGFAGNVASRDPVDVGGRASPQQPHAARGPTNRSTPPGRPPGGNLQLDPAVTVTSALTVANELKAMPPRTRVVAERIVPGGAPYAEIAAALGITERAVEGLAP